VTSDDMKGILRTIPDFARPVIRMAARQGGVHQVHTRGVVWFRSVFLPTLHRLDRASLNGVRTVDLVSHAWAVAGDVHDLNGAPLAAARAYLHAARRARLAPTKSYALAELASAQSAVGYHADAVMTARRAIALGDAESARSARHVLEGGQPICQRSDRRWHVAELLARGHHWKALRTARRLRGAQGHMLRSHCLGSAGRTEELEIQMRQLEERYEVPLLSSADVFYIPRRVFEAIGWL